MTGWRSAFVYTSSRMNAIQKTINIRSSLLKLDGTVLCCSAGTYNQAEANHLYRHTIKGSILYSSHVSIWDVNTLFVCNS